MRKKCIKFLTFFIISLLSCVLFSADTKALQLTTEVESTGTTFPVSDLYCKYIDSSSTTRAANCINRNASDSLLSQLRPTQKISTQENYYYKTYIILKSTAGDPQIFYQLDIDSANFSLISFNEVYNDELRDNYFEYCTTSNCVAAYPYAYFKELNTPYSKMYELTLQAKHTGDYYFTIGNGTNGVIWWDYDLQSHTTSNAYVGILNIEEFKSSGATAMNDKDDEDRENIESQQESSSSDSESSAEDATEQGTTLLGAFSAFVSALGNATPSDCTLDMDLGNLDMGEVDFCELDPPAGFSALASIFLILFCVPLSIATARKVINLFRSFQ